MLNLNKYLKKAKIDPEFKRRLLQDANRAIKDEFGEELPYEVVCREKLVFDVKPTKSFSESEFSKVAGGSDPPKQMRILKTVLRKGKDGPREKTNVYAPGFQPPNQQSPSKNLSSNKLNSVAGGASQENTGAPSPPYGVPGNSPYGIGGLASANASGPYDVPGSAPGHHVCWIPPMKPFNPKPKI